MPFLMADELRQRLAIVSRILHGSSTQHGKHKTLRQDRRAGRARQWGLYQRNSIALQYSGLRIELLCHESQRLLSLHRPVQTRTATDQTT